MPNAPRQNEALLRDVPAEAFDGAWTSMGHGPGQQPDLSEGCTHEAACKEACGICRAESWAQRPEGIAVMESDHSVAQDAA